MQGACQEILAGSTSSRRRFPYASSIVFVSLTLLVASYYLWTIKFTGIEFHWKYDLGGYYNYLTRGLARGQLHLPIQPSPELLALPDPYDPQANGPYKIHDMVLFNKRYYLYHGIGPAVLLMVPWRLITGYDIPEPFAVFLFCMAAWLGYAAAFFRLLKVAGHDISIKWMAITLVALAFSGSIPFLLNRIHVYEVAIAGGYFSTAAAVFFLVRGVGSRHAGPWFATAGFFAGIAVACRPHLGLLGLCVLAALAFVAWRSHALRLRDVASFALPLCLAGTLVLAYNYARFGNPFEFGLRYLLAGDVNQQRIRIDAAYVFPGLYYMLFSEPLFTPVFPWIRPVMRLPFNSANYEFPAGYFIEPIVGAFYLAPFILAAFLISAATRKALPQHKFFVRSLLYALLAAAVGILAFIAATGFSTQRYETDFLPLLVFIALVNCTLLASRAVSIVAGILIAIAVVANFALGVIGPYDDFLRLQPENYVRVARFFSPFAEVRPILNPQIAIDMKVRFTTHHDGHRDPLVFVGNTAWRQLLYVEHRRPKLRLVSDTPASVVEQEVSHPGDAPVRFEVAHSPHDGRFIVKMNSRLVLDHKLRTLVAAPAQVIIGRNVIDYGSTAAQLHGDLDISRKIVREASPQPR